MLSRRNFLRSSAGAAAPLVAMSTIDPAARANAAERPVALAAVAAGVGGELMMRDGIIGGAVRVSDRAFTEIPRFFGYFELPFSTPIQVVIR